MSWSEVALSTIIWGEPLDVLILDKLLVSPKFDGTNRTRF